MTANHNSVSYQTQIADALAQQYPPDVIAGMVQAALEQTRAHAQATGDVAGLVAILRLILELAGAD